MWAYKVESARVAVVTSKGGVATVGQVASAGVGVANIRGGRRGALGRVDAEALRACAKDALV